MQLMRRRNAGREPMMPARRRAAAGWGDMFDLLDRFWAEAPLATEFGEWEPSVNVSESNGTMQVRAELPGLNPEDIDVNVSGDLLTIKGEKTFEDEQQDEDFYRREIHTGTFQRMIALPAEADSEKVEAQFKNGILTIALPKTEGSRFKKVNVKAD